MDLENKHQDAQLNRIWILKNLLLDWKRIKSNKFRWKKKNLDHNELI